MRSIFYGWLAVISPVFCFGQKVMPSVTNMAGFDLSASGLVTTLSIGEPAIITLVSEKAIVTQGFLQPEILPCKDVSFSYYPNPVKDEITIEAFGCEIKIESIQVIDIWGRVVGTAIPDKDNKVQLGQIAQGVYIMKITLSNNQVNAIEIVKVSN